VGGPPTPPTPKPQIPNPQSPFCLNKNKNIINGRNIIISLKILKQFYL